MRKFIYYGLGSYGGGVAGDVARARVKGDHAVTVSLPWDTVPEPDSLYAPKQTNDTYDASDRIRDLATTCDPVSSTIPASPYLRLWRLLQ